MDRHDGPRQFRPYSFRDELIDDILDVNHWFALGPDRLTSEDLAPYSDEALDREYRLQRNLLYDFIAGRASAPVSSSAPGRGRQDPYPGAADYQSRFSDQFIWERSG